jgi:hypothetical protein
VDYGKPIEMENVRFACTRYTYSIIDYKKDSVGVKRTLNYNHEYKSLQVSYDTIWYFQNGLRRMERSYTDTTLNYTWCYHYVYDENGKLKQWSGRITQSGGYEVSQLATCIGKDTIMTKGTTRYQRDSAVGEYIIYQYHPESKTGWFKTYYNGNVRPVLCYVTSA